MPSSEKQPNIIYRINRSIASSKPGVWLFSRVLHHIDKPLFRLSKRKYTATSVLTGFPIVMLTTTGAKSGKPRTVPLLAIPEGDNLALIATNWGQSRYPAWYYNLRAHPRATISIQGKSQNDYVAREATPEEWERLWRKFKDFHAGYAKYKQRIAASSDRRIPIMVMTPVKDGADATTQD